MPGRKTLLVNEQIYHIFNRGVAAQPVFLDKRDYKRALELVFFYRHTKIPLRYSYFVRLPKERRSEILDQMGRSKDYLVDIIAYCLMPDHFHFLLKQLRENGISIFMSNVWNSYTRYFNVRRKRVGPVFQGVFKAVRVQDDSQFLHVQRYIHLNPYSSFLVKSWEELAKYPYSSLPEYLGVEEKNICNKELTKSFFKSVGEYKKFVFDQADYQRDLEMVKHLTFE